MILALLAGGLLVALVAVNALYIRHLESKDRRHDEQVNRLLVHIQAPEVAVMEHQIAQASPDVPAVDPFDNEDYWKAQAEQQAALDRIAEYQAQGLG